MEILTGVVATSRYPASHPPRRGLCRSGRIKMRSAIDDSNGVSRERVSFQEPRRNEISLLHSPRKSGSANRTAVRISP
jgi:hypothetical protein